MFGNRKKTLEKLLKSYDQVKTSSFNFGLIERYFLKSDKGNFTQVVSDNTYQDLDLEEVFMISDRTVSKVGQQYFYHCFRTIPADEKRSNRLEILQEKYRIESSLIKKAVAILSKLSSHKTYYLTALFQDNFLKKPTWFWIIPLLSSLSLISIILSFIYPQFLILLVIMLSGNFLIHYWNKQNLYQYSNSLPQLLILTQAANELWQTKAFTSEYPAIPEAIFKLNTLNKYTQVFKLEVTFQSEFAQLMEYILEIIKALFLIEPLLLFHVLDKLEDYRSEIERIFCFVGEIDTALSVASYRKSLQFYCRPEFTTKGNTLETIDVFHPLIAEPTVNSIILTQKSALITGSNMSGKSTFIRTIGINAILAQTINTCLANTFKSARFKVHSVLRISDDLLSKKSYFLEEVLLIKQLLDESRSGLPNLFLLDELFKGTNTIERISAAKAVLSYLTDNGNKVLVATHDLELTDFLEQDYNLYHFTESIQNNELTFDYKLKEGNLKLTNAIKILQLHNYPEKVVLDAQNLSKELKATFQKKYLTNRQPD